MDKSKGKYIFSENETSDIINSYLNGESSVSISKRYGLNNHKPILKLLHSNNVSVNRSLSTRKYKLNEKYFDLIDSPNKAYILGFLFADGSLNKDKQTISMSLQEDDWDILEKIRNEIDSEKQLEFLNYSNKKDFGYTYKNQYRLSMFSKYMCESLINIGMVQNKSLILEFPNIPKEFHSHFIRGYFDGDGSFCAYYTKENKFQPLVTITSTEQFCIKIQNILRDNLNIPCGNIYEASCKNGITKVLSISGSIQTKKVLDWLYHDAELFLERKHEKYINAFYLNNSLSA